MSARHRRARPAGVLVAIAAAALAGCSRGQEPAPAASSASSSSSLSLPSGPAGRAGLLAVSLPDLSKAADAVQAQVRQRFGVLASKIDNQATPPAELAESYGDMGRLFMVAEYLDAAEPCFANAATLVARDMRWPYFLGHIYRLRNQPEAAAAYFERALERQPDHLPSLLWLGEVYLAANRPDQAQTHLARAAAIQPGSAAAAYGLGRLTLARKDFKQAVTQFERTLELAPQASSVEYPLGLAYRELGNAAQARVHLARRGEGGVTTPDPLMDALGDLLQNAQAFEVRAAQALDSRDWPAAIDNLRKALALAPDNPYAHLNLGTALVLSGETAAARSEFEAALRLAPGLAKAHYALGILFEEDGREKDAIDAFARAVEHEPGSIEARLSLADALRRNGREEDSLPQYVETLRLDPSIARAQFGAAMALVRLRRHAEARARLDEGARAYPDQPGFPHALARLLAASPDARVRDGRRALLLMQPLLQAQPSVALNETMAMVQAELGDFAEAAAWQRNAIGAARQAGRADLVKALGDTLALYERGQPCRTPWRADDPIFHPRPQPG